MRNRQEVEKLLESNTRLLIDTIDQFPEDHFNTQPEAGSWSGGQVTEHLAKVETATLRLFSGKTKPADRDPESKIETVEREFLDFEKSFNAFGPIIPGENSKDKQKLISTLKQTREKMVEMIQSDRDLSLICTDFTHPLFGSFSIIEWIYFNIYHAERHIRQLKETKSRVIE